METQLPENIIGQLNDYLDKLMVDENRLDHSGTLVGQIGHGQQLTMDHLSEEMRVFNAFMQGMGQEYLKKYMEATGKSIIWEQAN